MTGRQTMNALQNWQALAVVTSRFHTDGELQQWDGWWEWLTDVGKDTAGALSHWTKPTTSGFFLQLERIQSAFTLSTNDSEEVSCIWCLVALALIGCDGSVTWRNTWENANFRPPYPHNANMHVFSLGCWHINTFPSISNQAAPFRFSLAVVNTFSPLPWPRTRSLTIGFLCWKSSGRGPALPSRAPIRITSQEERSPAENPRLTQSTHIMRKEHSCRFVQTPYG